MCDDNLSGHGPGDGDISLTGFTVTDGGEESDTVQFPPGEPQAVCAICGAPFESYDPEFAADYANVVCTSCDERAVTAEDVEPTHGIGYQDPFGEDDEEGDMPMIEMGPDIGDNPVFIDGQKCWCRYRFGGYVTRKDDFDCETVEEFYEKHRSE